MGGERIVRGQGDSAKKLERAFRQDMGDLGFKASSATNFLCNLAKATSAPWASGMSTVK